MPELFLLIESGAYDQELRLIAEQAQMLTLASGAAIALRQGELLVCRARAGSTAPDLGAQLDIQSGLSGECVRAARILVCGDTETDPRVNLDVCRYLGIRSIAVLPICLGEDVVGVFEVFSAQPGAFAVNEVAALESMRDLVISVIRPSPSPAESQALAALTARVAGQGPTPVFDPEDDLVCEIEQRAHSQPEAEAPTRAFDLIQGRVPQPAPQSIVPPPARTVSGSRPPAAPAPAEAAEAPPSTPAAGMSTTPPATPAASVSLPGPLAPSAPPRSIPPPIAPVPSRVVPLANLDPEDDLICEIEMRSPGQPILHPRALSTFAPAPHQAPEHTISRKLIIAGVIVALAGLIWLRWCNHGQPAAKNSPPGSTVQAASTAASPSASAAAPDPAASVPATSAPGAPANPESLPPADVSTEPNSAMDASGTAEISATPPEPRNARSVAVRRSSPIQETSAPSGKRPSSPVAKTILQPSASPPSSSIQPTARQPASVIGPSSGLQEQAKVVPPAAAPAAQSAQHASPAFTLRAPPATVQPAETSTRLSLSQAVVTASPDSGDGGGLSHDALRLLLQSAQEGDAGAQLALAVRYANGEGVKQSYPQALKWFTQARAKGVAPTQPDAINAWERVRQWSRSHP